MKLITDYILEKLNLGKTTLKDNSFDSKELFDDYNTVGYAITNKEKKAIADKYDIKSNKIREIQIAILDLLRENRFKQKEFNENDRLSFMRYDISIKQLPNYLEQEPIPFVEYLLDYYNNKIDKNPRLKKYQYKPSWLSVADRRIINIRDGIQDFLENN